MGQNHTDSVILHFTCRAGTPPVRGTDRTPALLHDVRLAHNPNACPTSQSHHRTDCIGTHLVAPGLGVVPAVPPLKLPHPPGLGPSISPSASQSVVGFPTEALPETPLAFREAAGAWTPDPDWLSTNTAHEPDPHANPTTSQRSSRPCSGEVRRKVSLFERTRN